MLQRSDQLHLQKEVRYNKEVLMSISLDQAYQIFMADRETSCADKTLIYYR